MRRCGEVGSRYKRASGPAGNERVRHRPAHRQAELAQRPADKAMAVMVADIARMLTRFLDVGRGGARRIEL